MLVQCTAALPCRVFAVCFDAVLCLRWFIFFILLTIKEGELRYI